MRQVVAALAVMILAILGPGGQVRAAQVVSPLVDADWIARNRERPEVVVLDIRNKIDGGSETAYRQSHIPAAVYSNYLEAGWRTEVDGLPGLLPPIAKLESLIGGLGFGNRSAEAIGLVVHRPAFVPLGAH